MQRCFVALDIPPPTRDALVDAQARMMAIEEPGAVIRPTAAENLHLTLKFLGATPDAQLSDLMAALQRVADAHAPVHAVVDGLSAFPRPEQPRSIYGAVPRDAARVLTLMDALSDICAELGFEPEALARVPHVTLARLNHVDPRGGLCAWLRQTPARRYGPVAGGHFTLYKSTLRPQGSLYEPIARFELTTQARR